MQADQRTTVVGAFENRREAEQAVDELHRAGFRDDQIGFATRGGEAIEGGTNVEETESHAGSGAAGGAVTGGLIGGILGALAAGLIPGTGSVRSSPAGSWPAFWAEPRSARPPVACSERCWGWACRKRRLTTTTASSKPAALS
jgi:hypothetical protein